MEKIINLKDLLKHEILDLCSVEEQIVESLPDLAENAQGEALKDAISSYQTQCQNHLEKLEKLKDSISAEGDSEKEKGFFSSLFGGSNKVTSKGVEGLIKQWQLLMKEDLTPEAMDAFIIGAIQKIGHYKIAGYGTLKSYAGELKMDLVRKELAISLEDEYLSDQSFTQLAIGSINPEAENAVDKEKDKKQALEDDLNYLGNSISLINSSDEDEEEA